MLAGVQKNRIVPAGVIRSSISYRRLSTIHPESPEMIQMCEIEDADEVLQGVQRPTILEEYRSDPDVMCIMAKHEDQVVGFLLYRIDGNDIEIVNIMVHPSWRRQGIGTALMEDLENFVAVEDYESVISPLIHADDRVAMDFLRGQEFEVRRVYRNDFGRGALGYQMVRKAHLPAINNYAAADAGEGTVGERRAAQNLHRDILSAI